MHLLLLLGKEKWRGGIKGGREKKGRRKEVSKTLH